MAGALQSPSAKQPRAMISDEQLWEALRKSGGLVSFAAQALGVSYQAVYQRVHGKPEWDAIISEAREQITDIAEAGLLKNVRAGKMDALRFWLTYQAKQRGYVARTEVTGADGQALAVQQTVAITVQYVNALPAPKDEDVPI